MNGSHGQQYGDPWPPRTGWFEDSRSRVNHYYRLAPDNEHEVRMVDWQRRRMARPNMGTTMMVHVDAPNPCTHGHGRPLVPICNRQTERPVRQISQRNNWARNCATCTRRLAAGR